MTRASLHKVLTAITIFFAASGALAADTILDSKLSQTETLFRNAGASSSMFDNSYGYALFPTIGKAGFVVGIAGGKGVVFVGGRPVGDTTMSQLTFGFQAGGEAYSQIIFFEDERSHREFAAGNFEFGATANAVVITAAANVSAGTSGGSLGVSGGRHDATTAGRYHKGMAVFKIAKAGLMFEASVGGQKFSYRPR